MFYSLVQTLVCVLLINGSLYALHLKGNAGGGSNTEPASAPALMPNGPLQHVSHVKQPMGVYDGSARLSEELADLAQLERERLMLLGIAKQTAVANAAAATGHHGRPIITGRIHMSPTEDVMGETDYGAMLMPPARGYMFGHVVKQPTSSSADDNLALAAEFTGGGGSTLRPTKYEYGRVVQPASEQTDYEAAAHIPLDLDAFMELEQEPEAEEDDFDLDGYQYLDELLAEQQQQHDWQQRGTNPYYALEELEAEAPLALRELFHNEQHRTPQPAPVQLRNGLKSSNIRFQQKWQRKRAQQPTPLKRNIFGQKKHAQQQHDEPQEAVAQPHYFNQRHHTLLAANSEATANKKADNKGEEKNSNVHILEENLKTAVNSMRNYNNLQQQQQQNNKMDLKSSSSLAASSSAAALKQNKATEQQLPQSPAEEKILVHPNHKRSGSSGLLPPSSHSIASQLMLRTARGQRQYDVPQIGK